MRGSKSRAMRAAVSLAILGLCLCPLAVLAKEPYKVGGIFSVTGPASFLGDPEKKSLEMAIEEINAQGGIDGQKIEAVIRDDEGLPDKAVLGASQLVTSEKVVALIGPSLTQTTLPLVPLVEKEKVLLISCAAGIEITEPVKPWVFKTAQNDVLAVAAIYKHMKTKNIKKIGLITVENSFGESGKKQLQEQAPKAGYEIVAAETFGGKDTDMTAQLTKIRSAQPDAIVCWGTNPGPAVVARNVQQMNIKVPLYQSHGVASPKFIELAGDAAEGIILPTGKILVANQLPDSDPQKAVLLRYIEDYEKRFKTPVSGFGGYAYDALNLFAKALKGTEGDSQKIRDNLEKLSGHVGISGTFNFTAQDHNGLGEDAFVMVQIQDGKWKLLAQ
jgi:branched-chain amino acid transport system substrate-binding protein